MLTRRKEKQAPYCTSKGSLGAAAPKPVFAYFCLAAKVGRARGHETIPWQRGGRNTPCTRARNLPARSAGKPRFTKTAGFFLENPLLFTNCS